MKASLLIETSGRCGAVGLACGDSVARALKLDESRRHARDLAECVRQLLAAEGLKPADTASVLVSIGPGSYTGLRVGLASAKAFAYAVGCPLVAVPTFRAIIECVPPDIERVDVIADGLQGLVFTQHFQRGDEWQTASDLHIISAVEWATSLTASDAVVGPGLALHAAKIPEPVTKLPEACWLPTLEGLWAAGRKMKPLSREEMFAVEPLYLRGSSAEEKRRAQSEPVSASSASCRVR